MGNSLCKERVRHGWALARRQCQHKAWRDGYCKQHHPDTKKSRRDRVHALVKLEMLESDLTGKFEEIKVVCMELVASMATVKWDTLKLAEIRNRCKDARSKMLSLHNKLTDVQKRIQELKTNS